MAATATGSDHVGEQAGAAEAERQVSRARSLELDPAAIEFELGCDAIYHRGRERWFAAAHRLTMFVNVFGGTAAVATVTHASPTLAVLAGLTVAFASALNLVCDLSGRARLHGELRATATELAARLIGADHEDLITIRREMMKAAARAPTPVPVLVDVAWNETLLAFGYPDDPRPVPAWERRRAGLLPL